MATDPIEPICGQIFTERGHEFTQVKGLTPEKIKEILPQYDALVIRSGTKVTKDIISAGTNLSIIGRAGTGVDNIDIRAATKKGILVANTPGGNTTSTAELTMAHILALARNIPQATASLKAGKWDRSKYTGVELTGKTLGIIGVGNIGKEVAKWCRGFGMNVIGYDPIMSQHAALQAKIEPVSLDEIFEKSDFITVHTPLNSETQYLINANTLAKCKKGVRIINCARGGIIDEAALLDALNSGHVAGASLDTFEIEPPIESTLELRQHPHVIVTPHLGASTYDAQERVAKAIAENICDIFDGSSFKGVVNAPNYGSISKNSDIIPFLTLAERIGSIQGQLLASNKMGGINISLNGKDISDNSLAVPFKAAVLKGALTSLNIENVTYVNSISIADELGIQVKVITSPDTPKDSPYTNTVAVELDIEGSLNTSRTIQGTIFGKNEQRLTQIDGFDVEIPPGENMLMFNNLDRPGVLHEVVSKVSNANINISHFSLGRKAQGGKAMGAIVMDTPIPPEIIESIRASNSVHNLVQIKIDKTIDPLLRKTSSQGHIHSSSKPTIKPRSPEFSSGPCKKRPGYNLANINTDVLGRSHRSKLGKSRLKKSIEMTKEILGIPKDYLVGIVPASDTGAFEMAMWNALGPRSVDACYWESFGKGWKDDALKHLKLPSVRDFSADYGLLPDLTQTNPESDILFTYNGTTSGVRVPNLDWIKDNRGGITFNDCTSAAFAMDIDWNKCDVSTFSWQKALGGEGAHGMLVLSPRAVERLETFEPSIPLPKIFRMTKKEDGKRVINKSIFAGDTINTPSMLCVEDYIDALEWAESVGGLNGLIDLSNKNFKILEDFVNKNDWIDFLAKDPSTRSNTSVCLTLKLDKQEIKKFVSLLESEGVAYDIGSYREAPDGLRIWCGATVEAVDVEALLPWLTWAYTTVKN